MTADTKRSNTSDWFHCLWSVSRVYNKEFNNWKNWFKTKMGYNDPVGDNHEQSNLLGSARGRLSADSQALFGTTKIKHSDFRVGSIKSIKITVLGHEDFAAYVDKNAAIKASFAQEKTLSKEQFGANHWKDYVSRRSGLNGQKTTDQYVMYYDRVVKTYTWNAPTETTAGTVSTNFAAPIEVPIEFGDTVEFEVQFDQMATNFEKYRRYMFGLYSWQLYKQTGTLAAPVSLPTSRGCANNRHAFQARYMFTDTQFTGDQTWLMTFRPKDRFNNHDNMDLSRAWGACAILKPRPVSGVTLTTNATITGKNSGIVCTDKSSEPVDLTGSLRGLTPGKRGNNRFVWQRDRVSSRNLAQFGTAAQVTIPPGQIAANRVSAATDISVSTPGLGANFSYKFTGYVEVTGDVMNYTGSVLRTWKYKIDSSNTRTITLSRLPDANNAWVSHPYNTKTSDKTSSAKLTKYRFSNIPYRVQRYSTDDYIRPSVLVDADAGGDPAVLANNNRFGTFNIDPTYMTFYADQLPDCDNSIEYYEDGEWKRAYSTDTGPDSVSTIIGGGSKQYEMKRDFMLWSYDRYGRRVSPKSWPQSAAWRITKNMEVNGQPGACSSSSATIHVAVVSKFQIAKSDITPVQVTTSFSSYSQVDVEWNPATTHEISIESPEGTMKYPLKIKYEVAFHQMHDTQFRIVKRDVLKKTSHGTSYSVSKNDSRNAFVSGRKYVAEVTAVHYGQDNMTIQNKEWRIDFGTRSKTFEILDCADPDIRDADTNVEYGEDSVITFVNRTGHKHKSHDIMWHQPNDHLDLTACRDYGTPKYWYELVSSSLTWQDARAAAEQKGGRLVVLNTQRKTDHFLNWFKNESGVGSGTKCWIGLNAIPDNEQWITGERIDTTITPTTLWAADGNWSTWETNTGASIYTTTNAAGVALDDHEARIKLTQYVVEYSGTGATYDYNTYQFIAGSFTHAEATIDAEKRKGRLAVLKNSSDNDKMLAAWRAAGSKEAYIGLVRDFSRGYDNTNGWRWADGEWIEKYNFRSWGGGEPNNWNEGAVHIGWHGQYWNDCVSHRRIGYMLERPGFDPSYVVTDTCVGSKTQLIADVECYVRRDTVLEFSSKLSGATPARVISSIPTGFQLGTPGQSAETTFYFHAGADDVLNTSKSNKLVFTPVISTTSNPQTVVNFFAVMDDDVDDADGPGNRGNVSVERGRFNICKIMIEDPGADILSGPAHSSAPIGSDRYKFRIYANVI